MVNAVVIALGAGCAMVGWRCPAVALIFPAFMVVNALLFHLESSPLGNDASISRQLTGEYVRSGGKLIRAAASSHVISASILHP